MKTNKLKVLVNETVGTDEVDMVWIFGHMGVAVEVHGHGAEIYSHVVGLTGVAMWNDCSVSVMALSRLITTLPPP